jgi:class 3 adenylate cyclase
VGTEAAADLLRSGRDAVARRAWPQAFEALSAASAQTELGPEDLELLAKASYWSGDQSRSIEARERAYALYLDRGDRVRAAFVALTLRREHNSKRHGSVAQGWLTRAEDLLNGEPEAPAHGYLALAHGQLAWGRGELDHALQHMDRGVEVARRHDDPDLRAWSLMYRGMVLIDLGQVEEGWALMEDVSAAAVGGELGGYTTGGVFCNVISTCRDLADYRRASEWADAAKRWCERQSINGFPGVCRVHRAEVMRLLGTWGEAETELQTACRELDEFSPANAGAAFHELGEVRLRMGDLDGAEEAFRRASELGTDPQPGRAMLLLATGKPEAAASALRRGLEEEWNKLMRARLLPTQAEVARVLGDPATALGAAEELDAIAVEYGSEAIRAAADWAHGHAATARHDPAEAGRRFRHARQGWLGIEAPYEAARASVALADAYEAEGDADAARIELETARAAFERLGAEPDLRRIDHRLGADAARPSVVRRTFVFTDIVGSTSLLEAIGDDAWSDLRRWHDVSIRACAAEHGGEEIDHAGDGFFLAFPDGASAIACAREIQRRLAEHRREHGFAPAVRIGMHAAEATREGEDYSGMGVHTAARVGAIAEGGEILASAATLEGMDDVETVDRRSVSLKGIAEPVEVAAVVWR